jgi:glycosyltransferase involved in cell wall biosynthesis
MAEWAERISREWQADVVHIHNFFPLMTPGIHHGARRSGAAVVQTLHNYRLLCASAMFLRSGVICEKCLTGSQIWGIVHKCYRQSIPGSIALVAMQMRANALNTWRKDVDLFIALTNFAKAKFVEGGIPGEKITVKPNFSNLAPPPCRQRHGGLYVGRLSPEKGVATLLAAWRAFPDMPLTILGDGPQRAELEASAPPNVSFLGSLPPGEVRRHMEAASFLVVPSEWYEGFPMTIVEAYSAGLPVIASNIGSLSEIIAHEKTGRLFTPRDASDLSANIAWMIENVEKSDLSGNSGAIFREKYSREKNIALLQSAYMQAIRNRDGV